MVIRLAAAETPFDTRKAMLKAVKEVNLAKVRVPFGGKEHSLCSGPSKPAFLRQQDTLVTDALNIARKLAGGDESRIDYDYPKERVFCDDR